MRQPERGYTASESELNRLHSDRSDSSEKESGLCRQCSARYRGRACKFQIATKAPAASARNAKHGIYLSRIAEKTRHQQEDGSLGATQGRILCAATRVS